MRTAFKGFGRPWRLAAVALVAWAAPTAMGTDFEASGVCVLETFSPEGAKLREFTSHFTAQKDGGKWQIHHFPEGTPTSEHVMFDGMDVYSLTRDMVVDQNAVRRIPDVETYFTVSNGVAYGSTVEISAGPYPASAPHFPRLLWYAFFSGGVLHQSPPPLVGTPWTGDARKTRSFRLSVRWPDPGSEFPEEVRFIADDKRWAEATRLMLPLPSPKTPFFPAGTVAGIYQVSAWTNWSGGAEARFPSEFEVRRYFPPADASNSLVCERYSCRVTNIGPLRSRVGPLELTEPCVGVIDGRFSNARYPMLSVMYHTTNHTVKATNDPSLRPLIARFQKQYDDLRTKGIGLQGTARARRPGTRPFVLLGCLLVALSLPTALGLRWLRKHWLEEKVANASRTHE